MSRRAAIGPLVARVNRLSSTIFRVRVCACLRWVACACASLPEVWRHSSRLLENRSQPFAILFHMKKKSDAGKSQSRLLPLRRLGWRRRPACRLRRHAEALLHRPLPPSYAVVRRFPCRSRDHEAPTGSGSHRRQKIKNVPILFRFVQFPPPPDPQLPRLAQNGRKMEPLKSLPYPAISCHSIN